MIVLRFVIVVSLQVLMIRSQSDNFLYEPWFRQSSNLDINLTYFHRLDGYQVQANAVPDDGSVYPWIAKVVHSRKNLVPYMCTASCIDDSIFVTSARCVFILKIKFTTVIYKGNKLTVKALVRPTQESKQLYADIGFIVVHDDSSIVWEIVDFYKEKPTDDSFLWFEQRNLDKAQYKAIGYAREKKSSTYPIWQSDFVLKELPVIMNMQLCSNILPFAKNTAAFNVLCYHSCSLEKFKAKDASCVKYHGVEGGAVYSPKADVIIAIATWGSFFNEFELPVGVAVTNSKHFLEDYECAKKIRDHGKITVQAGLYQSLCK